MKMAFAKREGEKSHNFVRLEMTQKIQWILGEIKITCPNFVRKLLARLSDVTVTSSLALRA